MPSESSYANKIAAAVKGSYNKYRLCFARFQLKEAVKMTEITVRHHGLKISIEGNFSRVSEQDLYTQAVVSLIRKAKIKEWQSRYEKADETDDDEDRDALDEFCSAVLIAVAHLYRAEDSYAQDEPTNIQKIGNLSIPENDSMFGALLGIITNLGNIRGMMLGGDIRAEEPKDLN